MSQRRISELESQARIANDLAQMCRSLESVWREQAERNEESARKALEEVEKLTPRPHGRPS
jgi:ElaB/YqjD/DUF883 family membrane-anchored ribosome-binding protein